MAFELTKTGSARVSRWGKEAHIQHDGCYDPNGTSLYRNAFQRITWIDNDGDSLKVVRLCPKGLLPFYK